MHKMLAVQIILILLFSGSLGGMLLYTGVYDDVKSKIVSVLCLGCLKLNPKTHLSFTFETANGEPYPNFVLRNLSKGPVFIHYRDDVCSACDAMEPIVKEIFGVNYSIEQCFFKTVNFNGTNVTFIHINLDHSDKNKVDSFKIYDRNHVNGVPMFVVVTLGYDRTFVKPCYSTGYAFLEKNTPQAAKKVLLSMIEDGIELYKQNREGFT